MKNKTFFKAAAKGYQTPLKKVKKVATRLW
jgi:hypothetical protein